MLITGASGGIGLELTRLFAQDRYNLVLVARTGETLDAVAADLRSVHGISTYVIARDLANPTAAHEIFNEVQQYGLSVDVLVNNAGLGTFGPFTATDLQTELEVIAVNMAALTALTHLFLPEMLKRKSGRILNVASTAAFQPGPLMAVYYASKAYVVSFSEALANELRGTGVTVTALCPGPTKTGFHARAAMEKSGMLKYLAVMDAETVAHAGYDAMMRGRTMVIPGYLNALTVFAVRFIPRSLAATIARLIQQEPGKRK